MKERVKNLSTPARRPTAACDVMDSAGAPHVVRARGGSAPAPRRRAAAHARRAGIELGVPALRAPAPLVVRAQDAGRALDALREPPAQQLLQRRQRRPRPAGSGAAAQTPLARAPAAHHAPPLRGGRLGARRYLRAAGVTPPHVRGERERLWRRCVRTLRQHVVRVPGLRKPRSRTKPHAAGAEGRARRAATASRCSACLSTRGTRGGPGFARRRTRRKGTTCVCTWASRGSRWRATWTTRGTRQVPQVGGVRQKHAMFWSEWAAFGHQYKGGEGAQDPQQGHRERRGGGGARGPARHEGVHRGRGVGGGRGRAGEEPTRAKGKRRPFVGGAGAAPAPAAAASRAVDHPSAGAAADDATVPVPSCDAPHERRERAAGLGARRCARRGGRRDHGDLRAERAAYEQRGLVSQGDFRRRLRQRMEEGDGGGAA